MDFKFPLCYFYFYEEIPLLGETVDVITKYDGTMRYQRVIGSKNIVLGNVQCIESDNNNSSKTW